MSKETIDPINTFDHVVVLMLENRSFDNLLGYLYEDGVPPGKRYAGLQEKGNFANPIPPEPKTAIHQRSLPIKPLTTTNLSPTPARDISM